MKECEYDGSSTRSSTTDMTGDEGREYVEPVCRLHKIYYLIKYILFGSPFIVNSFTIITLIRAQCNEVPFISFFSSFLGNRSTSTSNAIFTPKRNGRRRTVFSQFNP